MMTAMVDTAGRTTDFEGSFYGLYHRDGGLVLRYFRAAVIDQATAEDLCADTFCRAWDRWPGFRGGDDMARAWIMRIARNRLIDHTRRNKKIAFVGLMEASSGLDMEAAAVDRMAIREALASLKVAERDLLAMRVAGMSHGEIAQVQNRREDGVKKSWQRILLKLRPLLEVEP